MPAFSTYLADEVLDHTLGTAAYTSPTVYLALFTTNPTAAGTGDEVALLDDTDPTGYGREAITFNAASSQEADNDGDVEFGPALFAWGTITHVGLYDASTAGNLLYFGELTTPKTVGVGDSLKLADLGMTVTLT